MAFIGWALPTLNRDYSVGPRDIGPALIGWLQLMADCGVTSIQLNLGAIGDTLYQCDRRTWPDLAVAAMATGVKPRAVHLTPCKDAGTAPDCLRSQRLIWAIANNLGVKKLVVHLGGPLQWGPRSLQCDAEYLNALAEAAEPEHISILAENTPSCSLSYVSDVVKTVDKDNVRIQFDTGHWALKGEGHLQNLLGSIRDRLDGVELHDNNGIQDRHLPPGRGTLQWSEISDALKSIGYAGPLIIEPVLGTRALRPSRHTRDKISQAVEFVKENILTDNMTVPS